MVHLPNNLLIYSLLNVRFLPNESEVCPTGCDWIPIFPGYYSFLTLQSDADIRAGSWVSSGAFIFLAFWTSILEKT